MLERGRTLPSERTLRILAQRLGKPVGFFCADVTHTLFEGPSQKNGVGRSDEAFAVLEQVVEACRGAYLLAEARLLLATLHAKDRDAG
jgi:hypothetical protein